MIIFIGAIAGYFILGVLIAKFINKFYKLEQDVDHEIASVVVMWPIALCVFTCGVIYKWIKK